jgi:hypothetical protein
MGRIRKIAALIVIAAGSWIPCALAQEDINCLGPAAPLVVLESRKAGLALQVPAAWEVQLEEFSTGLTITDKATRCSLEIQRNPPVMALDQAVQLYEAMYFGENQLDAACRIAVSEAITWAKSGRAGTYSSRPRSDHVKTFFGSTETEIFVFSLKCPEGCDARPDWGTVTAIWASLRQLPQTMPQWYEGDGFFSPLYYFLKKPFIRFQKPVEEEERL